MRLRSGSSASDSAALTGHLLGSEVLRLEPLHRGGNSRVFLAVLATSTAIVKQFYRHPTDPRERDATEVTALEFLCREGVTCVPRLLGHDPEAALVVYEHVHGETFPPARATPAEVDELAGFVATLASLRGAAGAELLPLASEATLSLDMLVGVVERRLGRLRPVAEEERADLASFLTEELDPARERAEARASTGLCDLGIDAADEVAPAHRVLSPSDLGFHNALRREGGGLVVVDFEYFGWDDPAKLVSDFILHPAMELSPDLRRRFTGRVVDSLDEERLAARVRALHPLHAVRWALIVLNEFLPDQLDRRRFAGHRDEQERVLARQLAKARQLLEQVDNGDALPATKR